MNKLDETSLEVLRFASKLNLWEPIVPVADTSALTGFCYPQLKEVMGEFSAAGIMLLKKLEDLGYLNGTLKDRVILCPYCSAYNIIFRDICPECGSLNIETLQMVHHYRCGYVGSEKEFLSNGLFVCPKCSQKLQHIGRDFEKPSEVCNCLDCSWSGSEAVTAGRCLACNSKIEQNNYIVYDIKSYIITQEGLLAVKAGEVNLNREEIEKFYTRAEIQKHQWSILSLLKAANALGLIAERYGLKLSGMSIFIDAAHDVSIHKIDENSKIGKNIAANFLLEKNSVMDEKVSDLLKAVLEKIIDLIRTCDYAAVSEQATMFILLPETSAEQANVLATRLSQETKALSFSGFFKQTTLSIGISEWQKGFDATDLLQQSKAAMKTAIKNGGNQIKTFANGMASN